jgi:hypothetical protein
MASSADHVTEGTAVTTRFTVLLRTAVVFVLE